MKLASNNSRVNYLGETSIRKALEAISKEEKDDKKRRRWLIRLASNVHHGARFGEMSIRKALEAISKDGNSMVEHAFLAGEALIEAKAKLKKKEGYGNWIEWLDENFEASRRTAQNYMNLASKTQRVAFLGDVSLRKALEAISKEKKDDKKKTAMADTLTSRAAEINESEKLAHA
jgi:ribonucleotide monophosphatase NagD (HAD superfamily)